MKAVTDDSFQADVLDSERAVLVDFWADWCGPCHMLAPHLEQAALQLDSVVDFVKLDVDENPVIPARYGVVGIPTMMVFKDGEVVERYTGVTNADNIVRVASAHVEAL